MVKYKIILHTYFKQTYDPDLDSDLGDYSEEDDSKSELEEDDLCIENCNCFTLDNFDIDKHLLHKDNYKKYAKYIFDYPITDFEYIGNGSFSFILNCDKRENSKISIEKITDSILYNSFEDGMYESEPGSPGVVAIKVSTIFGKVHKEFGLIDCRSSNSIDIKRLKD
jgi:hypothetical protein